MIRLTSYKYYNDIQTNAQVIYHNGSFDEPSFGHWFCHLWQFSLCSKLPIIHDNQSYDDSSYSSDSYSKYPTQDNKYVCQRGPFEGFYVSSVEFCKPDFDDKKFDDKKDRHDDVKDRAVPICEICFRDNLETPQQLLDVQTWLNTEPTHNIGGYCSVIDLDDETES